MKVISINTAKRHNALSVAFLKERKIVVCVKDAEFAELSERYWIMPIRSL